jgi:hypothetical protein
VQGSYCLPHKHDVSLANVLAGVSGEEQVASTAFLHNLVQPRLIDGEVVGVPGLDPLLVAACRRARARDKEKLSDLRLK